MFNSNNSKNNKFIDCLNEILSAENAGIERLHRRIEETPIQESKNILQDHITEEKEQQQRLKNIISYYGRKPTDSKADILSFNSLTTAISNTMKNNTQNNTTIKSTGHDNNNNNNNSAMTPKEVEILNTQEDALIKNDEILAHKTILKLAEKIMAKDVINILKQNLQEKESRYKKIRTFESEMLNYREENNHPESFKLGSAVADMLTSYWNSQKSPSKVYVFNRRVHHGAIGALLGLSSTLYKNNPIVTGILSGLGTGLQKDDYNDSKEWFLFKKKEDDAKENK
jgi:ferritin-like metal-binding protein YciE